MAKYRLVVEATNGSEDIVEADDDESAQRDLMDLVANTVDYYMERIDDEEAP